MQNDMQEDFEDWTYTLREAGFESWTYTLREAGFDSWTYTLREAGSKIGLTRCAKPVLKLGIYAMQCNVIARKRRYFTGAIGNDLPHAAGDLPLLLD